MCVSHSSCLQPSEVIADVKVTIWFDNQEKSTQVEISELFLIPPFHSEQSEFCHSGMVEPACMEV